MPTHSKLLHANDYWHSLKLLLKDNTHLLPKNYSKNFFGHYNELAKLLTIESKFDVTSDIQEKYLEGMINVIIYNLENNIYPEQYIETLLRYSFIVIFPDSNYLDVIKDYVEFLQFQDYIVKQNINFGSNNNIVTFKKYYNELSKVKVNDENLRQMIATSLYLVNYYGKYTDKNKLGVTSLGLNNLLRNLFDDHFPNVLIGLKKSLNILLKQE